MDAMAMRVNPFTAARLLLVPAFWVLALAGLDRWLGVGLAVAALAVPPLRLLGL